MSRWKEKLLAAALRGLAPDPHVLYIARPSARAERGPCPPWVIMNDPVQTFEVPSRHHAGCTVVAARPLETALRQVWRDTWRRAVVLADSNTGALFGDAVHDTLARCGVHVHHARFRAGEASKTRATKGRLEDELFAAEVDRNTCVVAVGGGVTLDLAGFVAATALRGLPTVYVATSLLAMVDAAIGGKVAVNVPAGKNLVGLLYPPHAVLLHLDALRLLPAVEVRNGLVEMVKHGVVADAGLFEAMDHWLRECHEPLLPPPPELIVRAARVKAGVVARDESENGQRRILNFGHTIGHALEAASEHRIAHGAAVAIGMRVEASVALGLGLLDEASHVRIVQVLDRIAPTPSLDLPFAELEPYLRLDKKNRAGEIMCALPTGIGQMDQAGGEWRRAIPLDRLGAEWEAVLAHARESGHGSGARQVAGLQGEEADRSLITEPDFPDETDCEDEAR